MEIKITRDYVKRKMAMVQWVPEPVHGASVGKKPKQKINT